jgi:phosphoglycerol transferase MdoB-like AlkP superfamily enzyme
MKHWIRFIIQFQKDLKLWLFCVLSLFFFRVTLILVFRERIGTDAQLRDVLAAVVYGLRYDSMVASYTVLLPFLLSLCCHFLDVQTLAARVRTTTGVLFLIFSSTLFVVTFGYFREFNNQFNHFLFGFLYDDTSAILLTIWKEYHPLRNFSLMFLLLIPVFAIKKRFLSKKTVFEETLLRFRIPPFLRISITLLTLVILVCGMRGSLGRRPAQRKDAGVIKDEFLNKTILNPYMSLRYAVKDHRELSDTKGLAFFLPDENVDAAAKYLFERKESFPDLSIYMRKVAKGTVNKPAKHIFLVVMESYDAWPLLEKYRSLELTRGLTDLARRGLAIRSFLPASSGTMTSLAPIPTGLADAGLHTSLQKSATKPYRSSIAETFTRLGYKTRFFYGGKLKWQRIDEFTKGQGFNEIYGASHMGEVFSGNEWGVDDEYLFDFVAKKVRDSEKSFNLIMTTTYHPPYDIDVYAKGYPVKEIPEDLEDVYDRNTIDLETLGHLWYADKAVADFVKIMEARLTAPLFAMTGDHYGRKFINSQPDFFERSAVPFVLYGKEVLKGISLPDGVAGSHIDIGPTLIELVAPKSFPYYSLGHNLLEQRKPFLGVRRGTVIGADFIADVALTRTVYPTAGKREPEVLPSMEELTKVHNAVHGVSWWIIRNGSALPGKN